MKILLKNTEVRLAFHPLTWTELTFDPNDAINAFIPGSLIWEAGVSYIFDRGTIQRIRVQANASKNAGIAFLTNDSHIVGQSAALVPGTSRVAIPMGTSQEIAIPGGCNYIYIFSGASNTPTANLPTSAATGSF